MRVAFRGVECRAHRRELTAQALADHIRKGCIEVDCASFELAEGFLRKQMIQVLRGRRQDDTCGQSQTLNAITRVRISSQSSWK